MDSVRAFLSELPLEKITPVNFLTKLLDLCDPVDIDKWLIVLTVTDLRSKRLESLVRSISAALTLLTSPDGPTNFKEIPNQVLDGSETSLLIPDITKLKNSFAKLKRPIEPLQSVITIPDEPPAKKAKTSATSTSITPVYTPDPIVDADSSEDEMLNDDQESDSDDELYSAGMSTKVSTVIVYC